jgi:shikimate kinase
MNPASNLTFVGPMGAGKTSIGRRVAERFGLTFVDADHWIERQLGVSIRTIFELEGEAGFREREREALQLLCAGRGQLIATGGGAVLDPINRERLTANG